MTLRQNGWMRKRIDNHARHLGEFSSQKLLDSVNQQPSNTGKRHSTLTMSRLSNLLKGHRHIKIKTKNRDGIIWAWVK